MKHIDKNKGERRKKRKGNKKTNRERGKGIKMKHKKWQRANKRKKTNIRRQ
jgi:hypothetical protein